VHGSLRVRAEQKQPFQRSPTQQAIADLDKVVVEAQKAAGEALINALGPVADLLRIRPSSNKPRLSSGQVPGWSDAADYLNQARLKSVTPKQAKELMDIGWVLLDVSPAEDFAEYHAKGAISAPSVRYGAATGLRGALRSVAYASLSVRPAEDDLPGFLEAAQKALAGNTNGVIVACASGGTLRKTVNFPAGQASRSLFAAEALLRLPGMEPQRVLHLRGGLAAWFADGMDGEGSEEAWEARKGRTPSVGGPMYEQDAPELQ
jgi:rhodanese-related sulfurtransferase